MAARTCGRPPSRRSSWHRERQRRLHRHGARSPALPHRVQQSPVAAARGARAHGAEVRRRPHGDRALGPIREQLPDHPRGRLVPRGWPRGGQPAHWRRSHGQSGRGRHRGREDRIGHPDQADRPVKAAFSGSRPRSSRAADPAGVAGLPLAGRVTGSRRSSAAPGSSAGADFSPAGRSVSTTVKISRAKFAYHLDPRPTRPTRWRSTASRAPGGALPGRSLGHGDGGHPAHAVGHGGPPR